jgi:hypothetical protein
MIRKSGKIPILGQPVEIKPFSRASVHVTMAEVEWVFFFHRVAVIQVVNDITEGILYVAFYRVRS